MKKLLCVLAIMAMTVLPLSISAQSSNPCTIESLPWLEDFSGIPDATTDDSIPCWRKGMSTGYAMMPIVNGEQLYYYIRNMFGNNVMWAIMPPVGEDIDMNGLELSFNYSSTSPTELLVGVIEPDVYVYNVTPIDTLLHVISNGNGAIVGENISFADIESEGRNIIFRVQAAQGTMIAQMSIDNVDLHEMSECSRPADVTLVEATETTATVTWSGENSSYIWHLYNSANDSLVDEGVVSDTEVVIENLIAGTGYYFRVAGVCGPGDTSSYTMDMAINLFYCEPAITSYDGSGITNVTFGTAEEVVNDNTLGYYVNSSLSGAVPAGTPANVAITYSTDGYDYGTIIWVDWNKNYIFDGNEVVWYGVSGITVPSIVNASFMVPAEQEPGFYRMRIAGADMAFDSYITSANAAAEANSCFASNFAVARDYTLHVTDVPDCMPPAGLVIASLTEEEVTMAWEDESGLYVYELTIGDSIVATGSTGDNTVTIGDLAANTNYTFSIHSQCGSDESVVICMPFYTGYCEPSSNNVDGSGITNVSFGYGDEVVNNSRPVSASTHYGNFSNLVGSVPAGLNVNLEITYATGFSYGTIVWVDWNRNMVFDRDEVVYVGESLSDNPTTLSASFPVLASQDTGLYRMRIAGADMAFDDYTGSIQAAAALDPCFSTNWATAQDYTIRVTEAPNCVPPANLTLDSITATAIYLSWTPQGQGTQWIVNVNDSVELVAGITNVAIENLDANTEYIITVRTYCGGSDTSIAISGTYTTECNIISVLPWDESFENYPVYPTITPETLFDDPCWTMLNPGYSYPVVVQGTAHTGDNALLMGSDVYINTTLGLPVIDAPLNTLQLTLWLYSSYGNANVEVGVLSNPSDANSFHMVAVCAPTENSEYQQFEVNFDGYNSGVIALRYGGTYYNSIYVDDISVRVAPSCRKAQGVAVRSVESDGATVVITDTNNVMNYRVVMFAGEDTAYNQLVTDTVVTVYGLASGTFYRVEVSSLCSDGTETIPVFTTFNTECTAIDTLPFGENFDNWPVGYNASFNPCWARGPEENKPYIEQDGDNRYLNISNYGNGYGYVIMPMLGDTVSINTLELSMEIKSVNNSYGELLVGMIDSNVFVQNMTPIDTIASVNTSSSVFDTRFVSFANYQGEKRYILLYSTSNEIDIDNMSLHLLPTCAHVENVAVEVNGLSAAFTWDGVTPEYQYRLVDAGTDSIVATAIVSDTFAVVNNLEIDGDYVFNVRSVCGAGDTGIWIGNVVIHVGYCIPVSNNVDNLGIINVTFGENEVVNNSERPTAAPYYGNYTNLVGDAHAGTSFDVTITYGTGFSYGTLIWIDWNNNMQFEGTEVVYYGMSNQADIATLVANINIPATQDTGLYRMRIAGSDFAFDTYVASAAAAATADPCFSISWGLSHDYTLRVTEAPSCLRPAGLEFAIVDDTSATFVWESDAINYQYDLTSANGDIIAAGACPNTEITVGGLDMGNDYVFRVRAICGIGDSSAWATTNVHWGYCTPSSSSVDGSGITNVTFGDSVQVNNSQLVSNAPYYGDFTNMVGSVTAGDSVDVIITYATGGYSYGTLIWVDWNKDFVFDGDEVVYYGESADGNDPAVLHARFYVSDIQASGMYRMRIAGADMLFNDYITSASEAANADPCFAGTYAITHDYTLNVMPASAVITYQVTLSSANPNMGTVSPNGITTVVEGENFTAMAMPAVDHVFTGWLDATGDTVSKANPYTFTVNSDVNLVGTFRFEGVGIEDVSADAVSLYPNPASVTVTLIGIAPKSIVTLVDINGHVCGQWSAEEWSMTIDLDGYTTGAYFVRIVGEQAVVVRKLIIK